MGNGFYSQAYLVDGKIIIVFRGTDTDRGTKERIKAITFNAYGTKQIKDFLPKYPENVINYGNSKDTVFTSNIKNQVGLTSVIYGPSKEIPSLKYHSIENMGELSIAKIYSPAKEIFTGGAAPVLSNRERLKARLESEWAQSSANKALAREKFTTNAKSLKNYVNEKTKSNRIYTEEEISTFSRKKLLQHSSAIEYQRKTIGILGKKQVKEAVSAGGMVFVHAYVRADGIRVESYYRSRPA